MVFLGLGSNVGDRRDNLRKAIRFIDRHPSIQVLKVSPLYESEAMLLPGSDQSWQLPFLNLAIKTQTTLNPRELLRAVKVIEIEVGRIERGVWAPREMDIDILLWSGMKLDSEELILPHAGLSDRPFALLPLQDLECNFDNEALLTQARKWQAAPLESLPFDTRRTSPLYPEWVGIINVTPDSFSDGGDCLTIDSALKRAEEMLQAGARVLDIGAESTRPGATPLTPQQEWERLRPVLTTLSDIKGKENSFLISVDTFHHFTAAKALALGVDWINDVSGCQELKMRQLLADSTCRVVVMHSLSVPVRRDEFLAPECSPTAEVSLWAQQRQQDLESKGIDPERLIFDPGIGFGKTAGQSEELIRQAKTFHSLHLPLLIGHSRKSFLSRYCNKDFCERDIETAAISTILAHQGIDYLRVHNIELNRRIVDTAARADGVISW